MSLEASSFPSQVTQALEDWHAKARGFLTRNSLQVPDGHLQPTFNQLIHRPTAEQTEGERDVDAEYDRERITEMIAGFQKLLHGEIDKLVSAEMDEIKALPPEIQQAALQKKLTECLDQNFALFWGFLESLGRLVEARERVDSHIDFNPNKPDEYLRLNEMICFAFIEAVDNHPDKETIYTEIYKRIDAHHATSREPVRFFKGAAVPSTFKHFVRFGKLCAKDEIKFDTYTHLLRDLQEVVQTATNGRQNAYPFDTCLESWNRLYDQLREMGRDLVLTTEKDYISMHKNKRTHVVPGETEEEIIEEMRGYLKKGRERPGKTSVFLTSVLRDGTRLDVDHITEVLKKEFPNIFVVVDAAQDNLFHTSADAVMFSKRLGGPGSAVLMLSNNAPEEVKNACTIRSTKGAGSLATTYAAVRCETRPELHYASRYKDLLWSQSHWRFRGRGTFINSLCNRIKATAEADASTNAHFDVVFTLEPEGDDLVPRPNTNFKPWNSSRIIKLQKKPDSPVHLGALGKQLEARHGVHVDVKSITEASGFERLKELSEMPYSDETCRAFCDELMKFQQRNHDFIMNEMLTLPEVFNDRVGHLRMTPELFDRQKEKFRHASQHQEMLRILLDIRMIEDDVDYLMASLSQAIEETLAVA